MVEQLAENNLIDGTDETAVLRSRIAFLERQLLESIEYNKVFNDDNASALQSDGVHSHDEQRAMSSFIANVSHELRTPLNTIVGFAGLLLDDVCGELTCDQRDSLNRMDAAGRKLLRFVNELIDLSMFDSHSGSFLCTQFSMKDILEGVIIRFASEAASRRITIEVDCAESCMIVADRRRMIQVAEHLFENALKFSNNNCRVGIKLWQQEEMIYVSVWDEGIGIGQEHLTVIFDRFHQIDGALSRRSSGTGLGLALAKKILNLHGGKIWVESIPGRGSSFYFSLPKDTTPFIEHAHSS